VLIIYEHLHPVRCVIYLDRAFGDVISNCIFNQQYNKGRLKLAAGQEHLVTWYKE